MYAKSFKNRIDSLWQEISCGPHDKDRELDFSQATRNVEQFVPQSPQGYAIFDAIPKYRSGLKSKLFESWEFVKNIKKRKQNI